MPPKTHWPFLGALACVAAVIGCGGSFESSVKGLVSLDGEPLPTGTVTFIPSSAEGSMAYAKVDDSGWYQVQTGREFGLPPGEYRVTVVAREKPASLYGKNGGPPPPGKQITPDWYRSPETSGLQVTVERGGNKYDIELTSDPPAGWTPKKAGKRTRRRR